MSPVREVLALYSLNEWERRFAIAGNYVCTWPEAAVIGPVNRLPRQTGQET